MPDDPPEDVSDFYQHPVDNVLHIPSGQIISTALVLRSSYIFHNHIRLLNPPTTNIADHRIQTYVDKLKKYKDELRSR